MTSSLESGPGSKRSSRKRAQQNKTPYHGVRKRTWGRYVSEIRLPGKKARVWLGSFNSPEKAARAYDSAAFFLKGQAAVLNFPDRVGLLPRPESSSTKDIQVAAAKAAVAYEVGESVGEQDVGYNDGGLESGSGGESESSVWWGLDELDLGPVSFGAVKAGPFLSPLRFDRVGSQELVYSSLMDEEEEFLLFPTWF